jgi:hypothetical protein
MEFPWALKDNNQEFTDSAFLSGNAGMAYDALWNRCERSFRTHAVSLQTDFIQRLDKHSEETEKE